MDEAIKQSVDEELAAIRPTVARCLKSIGVLLILAGIIYPIAMYGSELVFEPIVVWITAGRIAVVGIFAMGIARVIDLLESIAAG